MHKSVIAFTKVAIYICGTSKIMTKLLTLHLHMLKMWHYKCLPRSLPFLSVIGSLQTSEIGFSKTGAPRYITAGGSEAPIRHMSHMLFHALGRYHEHQRQDRDAHVRVIYSNIRPGMIHSSLCIYVYSVAIPKFCTTKFALQYTCIYIQQNHV